MFVYANLGISARLSHSVPLCEILRVPLWLNRLTTADCLQGEMFLTTEEHGGFTEVPLEARTQVATQ